MPLEIERRFLIKDEGWKHYVHDSSFIEQGYLAGSSTDWIVRVRKERSKYKLALKKHINRITNHEFEYEIPYSEGEIIISNIKNTIKKRRHYLIINKQEWVIDCFEDKNFPLEIAEIELKNNKEVVQIPSFISKEISGLKSFSNYELSKYPFETWKKVERNNLFTH